MLTKDNALKKFLQRHAAHIQGVLSDFDRIRLRGSLRLLQSEGGVATWLGRVGVKVKDFGRFAEGLTKRFCQQAEQTAADAGRKEQYLPGVVNKEELVQDIRREQGVADNGLIAVLSSGWLGNSTRKASAICGATTAW